jgi:hypothetical protein
MCRGYHLLFILYLWLWSAELYRLWHSGWLATELVSIWKGPFQRGKRKTCFFSNYRYGSWTRARITLFSSSYFHCYRRDDDDDDTFSQLMADTLAAVANHWRRSLSADETRRALCRMQVEKCIGKNIPEKRSAIVSRECVDWRRWI